MGYAVCAFSAVLLFLFLAYHRSSLLLAVTSFFVVLLIGLWSAQFPVPVTLSLVACSLLPAAIFVIPTVRRNVLTRLLFQKAQALMPRISETEQQALDAGTLWWDQEIWSGRPDWGKLLDYPAQPLTSEEQAFLDGPVTELCAMLDDWKITHQDLDLPSRVWEFLKQNRFFGIIIPKEYGGLGFSAQRTRKS